MILIKSRRRGTKDRRLNLPWSRLISDLENGRSSLGGIQRAKVCYPAYVTKVKAFPAPFTMGVAV